MFGGLPLSLVLVDLDIFFLSLLMIILAIAGFQVLLSKIKLHMSAFLGHLQTITTFAASVLLVSFFFSHMSITNLSLGQGFVVFVVVAATVSSIPSLHTSSSRVQQSASRDLLGSVSIENFDCVSCQLGKQPTLPFNTSESMSTDIFNLIHFDVWWPSSVSSIDGSRYFVVFIDDYSRYNWIFHMKHHSELLQVYCNFAKMVETQFSKRIKIFQSDNALEYTQYAFQAVLHSYGIIHQLTCQGTSQQNGRDKRTCQWLCYNVEKG